MNKKNQAFTLIELMIAIMIIGLLSSIVTISLKEIRRNARDTKRISDIKLIQLSLEEYRRDEGIYPDELVFGESLIGSSTDKIYISKIPKNSQPASKNCQEKEYVYKKLHDGDLYVLEFCLEKKLNEYQAEMNCTTPIGLEPCSEVRDSQRVFDIKKITNAMLKMYHENGYYFKNEPSYYFIYNAWSLANNEMRKTNCSTVTSETDYQHGTYGWDIPCPEESDWCIKLSSDIYDTPQASGQACESGDVYLRNIPLNNYLPLGEWATGLYPYNFFGVNNFGGTEDDYFRIKYRLESSATNEFQSDHFLNGLPADCHYDAESQTEGIVCE